MTAETIQLATLSLRSLNLPIGFITECLQVSCHFTRVIS
jgi:hypothetical protein